MEKDERGHGGMEGGRRKEGGRAGRESDHGGINMGRNAGRR